MERIAQRLDGKCLILNGQKVLKEGGKILLDLHPVALAAKRNFGAKGIFETAAQVAKGKLAEGESVLIYLQSVEECAKFKQHYKYLESEIFDAADDSHHSHLYGMLT